MATSTTSHPLTMVIVDADNIALAGHPSCTGSQAMERLQYVHHRVQGCTYSLAVISRPMLRAVDARALFELPAWTWRIAERGPDAADHQLLEFVRHMSATHPIDVLHVASGDHIFAKLEQLPIGRVVVTAPPQHRGVARILRSRQTRERPSGYRTARPSSSLHAVTASAQPGGSK